MFPKLTREEVDRLRHFGTVRRYRAGESLFATGEVRPGMFVIISGTVAVTVIASVGVMLSIGMN
jgi:thioredoxin reductase (NADPH)